MNKIVMTGNNTAYTYLPMGGLTADTLTATGLMIAATAGLYQNVLRYNLGQYLGRYQGVQGAGFAVAGITYGTLNSRLGFDYIINNILDTTTFQNLWRPSQSGSPIVVSTRSAIAQSYACLVNSACVYVYVDFVQGSSQDSQGNGGLLGVVPLNASNNSVGYYDKVMSNDLLKIPSQLQEITVFFKDERLNNFLLPRSAIANLELGFTYY